MVSIRVPLWRVRRVYAPAGAIHAWSGDAHQTACGVPTSMLVLWPEHDFATHDFPHSCPNCAVALARTPERTVAPEGFRIPGARRPADDLSVDPR